MSKFERDVSKYFSESLRNYDFNEIFDGHGKPMGLYERIKKEVRQTITIDYNSSYSRVRVEVEFNDKSRWGLHAHYAKKEYYYGTTSYYLKSNEKLNDEVYYPKIEKNIELFPKILEYLKEVVVKMDDVLDSFIIRRGWDLDVYNNIDEYVSKYEDIYKFPETIDEMASQFEDISANVNEDNLDLMKETLLMLTAVYSEYIIRNYSLEGCKYSKNWLENFIISAYNDDNVSCRPILHVYEAYITKKYYRSLSKKTLYLKDKKAKKAMKALDDFSLEKKYYQETRIK